MGWKGQRIKMSFEPIVSKAEMKGTPFVLSCSQFHKRGAAAAKVCHRFV